MGHPNPECEKAERGVSIPRRDVMHLKAIFDEYDADGDGSILLTELEAALRRRMEEKKRVALVGVKPDGKKATLTERQAARGVVIDGGQVHHMGTSVEVASRGMFRVLDFNGDGRVSFTELLRIVYPHASAAEMKMMKRWVGPKVAAGDVNSTTFPQLDTKPSSIHQLTPEQYEEALAIFHLYDRDGNGVIDVEEVQILLAGALGACCNPHDRSCEEAAQLLREHDLNHDDVLDIEEFTLLLASTGVLQDARFKASNYTRGVYRA